MYNEWIKLAQSNIREAMTVEFETNRQTIEHHVMNRRTPRHIKEIVFYAMARNHAITHFLSLDNPSPQDLFPPFPNDEEYWKLMKRVGATRYPFRIRYRAEHNFLQDYTHLDYKRIRYFLDTPLPEKPIRYKVFEYIGNTVGLVLTLSIQYWWIIAISLVFLVYLSNQNDYKSYSGASSGNNTFNQGGATEGNYSPSWSSDSVQIPDTPDQAGFGNSGVTGHDGANESAIEQISESNVVSNTEQQEQVDLVSDVNNNIDVPDQQDPSTNKERVLADSLLSELNQESHKEHLTLGSTKKEVVNVLGQPDNASDSNYSYGFSQIYFENNKVVGWSTIDEPLEMSLGEKKDDAPPFTLGSSRQQVVDAMGTPSSVHPDSFEYDLSHISFSDDKVSGWYTINEPLNVEIKSDIKQARPFAVGSTIEEVFAIMGTPDSYNEMSLGYEHSIIFIKDGKVNSYSDISHNLITAE